MNKELERKLNSVGKQAFVRYFEEFKQYASGIITREDSIAMLLNDRVSNEAGAAIRVGNARIIFDNNWELEALELIIQSRRLPRTVIQKAKVLINEYAG